MRRRRALPPLAAALAAVGRAKSSAAPALPGRGDRLSRPGVGALLALLAALLALPATSCAGCSRPATAQPTTDAGAAKPAPPDAPAGAPAPAGEPVIDDGFPRAAAFDEDDDEEAAADEGADAGAAAADAGLPPEDREATDVDAGVTDEEVTGELGEGDDLGEVGEVTEGGDVDAGPLVDPAIIAEIEALRPVITPDDLNLSTDLSQSRAPLDVAVTRAVRDSLASDPELSNQTRTGVYVTTLGQAVVLQGEVPTERERTLIEDKVEDLVDDRYTVTNMLVVRDRGLE